MSVDIKESGDGMTSIFIVSNYLLFGYGLKNLLLQDGELDVLGQETDIDQASEQIKTLQPDVVILDHSNIANGNAAEIAHIFDVNPTGKVVSVNLHSNKLSVYQATHRMVEGPTDLIDVIKSEPD